MTNKIKKAIAIILAGAAVFSAIALYNYHEDSQMDAYARENNCTGITIIISISHLFANKGRQREKSWKTALFF